jgi:hypothetical protein
MLEHRVRVSRHRFSLVFSSFFLRVSAVRFRLRQALGTADVVTVTYLGAAGRKLIRQDAYNTPNSNFSGEVDLMINGAT